MGKSFDICKTLEKNGYTLTPFYESGFERYEKRYSDKFTAICDVYFDDIHGCFDHAVFYDNCYHGYNYPIWCANNSGDKGAYLKFRQFIRETGFEF